MIRPQVASNLTTMSLSILFLAVLTLAAPVETPAAVISETKLTASDAAAGASFGTVGISGDTIVVGASGKNAAYVFVRDALGHFVEQAKLVASDGVRGDFFAFSVGISGDTVVVGALGKDDVGVNSGAAYVFVRSGTTWTQQAKLTASDAAAGDEFGLAVAVSEDTILVGAFGNDDAGSGSGSAYVFVRGGAVWSEQAKLTASDAAAGDSFGLAVAISGDTAVVGASRDDDAGTSSGSAYVFVRSGTTWTEQAKLTASDAAAVDLFADQRAVAIDGDTVVIGAVLDDDAGANSGSAYVFVRNGTTWTEQAKLTASDGASGDLFGQGVAISGDTIVVGAAFNDDAGASSGSAYVFVRAGSTWTEQLKLTASDGAAEDRFGSAVGISGDTIVVGATGNDDVGAAYVYAPGVLLVAVDIKPGSDPNSINLGSKGVLPVAILSSADFDATTVDPLSVVLAGATVRVKGNGQPQASVEDVNGDGLADLVLKLETAQLQLTAGDTEATLTGTTLDGQAIQGSDTVRIVP